MLTISYTKLACCIPFIGPVFSDSIIGKILKEEENKLTTISNSISEMDKKLERLIENFSKIDPENQSNKEEVKNKALEICLLNKEAMVRRKQKYQILLPLGQEKRPYVLSGLIGRVLTVAIIISSLAISTFTGPINVLFSIVLGLETLTCCISARDLILLNRDIKALEDKLKPVSA